MCDIFSEKMDGSPKNWRDKTVSLTAMEQIQSLWVLTGRPGNKSVLESPESQAWLFQGQKHRGNWRLHDGALLLGRLTPQGWSRVLVQCSTTRKNRASLAHFLCNAATKNLTSTPWPSVHHKSLYLPEHLFKTLTGDQRLIMRVTMTKLYPLSQRSPAEPQTCPPSHSHVETLDSREEESGDRFWER